MVTFVSKCHENLSSTGVKIMLCTICSRPTRVWCSAFVTNYDSCNEYFKIKSACLLLFIADFEIPTLSKRDTQHASCVTPNWRPRNVYPFSTVWVGCSFCSLMITLPCSFTVINLWPQIICNLGFWSRLYSFS